VNHNIKKHLARSQRKVAHCIQLTEDFAR
jgi:hypothetical protein